VIETYEEGLEKLILVQDNTGVSSDDLKEKRNKKRRIKIIN